MRSLSKFQAEWLGRKLKRKHASTEEGITSFIFSPTIICGHNKLAATHQVISVSFKSL